MRQSSAAVRYGFAYGGLVAGLMAFCASTMAGSNVDASAPDDAVVARVGSETVTAGELTRRIQSVPPFQLKMFGSTEDEIKRNFLERVLVRDLLLSQGAVLQKVNEDQNVQDRERATLRTAIVQQIRLEALATPITDADVERYYKENYDKFHAPERIAIWRILLATREDALKVIEELKKDTSPKRWNDLVRERSLDKATNMRGGNLGFVAPDGKTTDSSIVVDTSLLEAAKKLKDGELSPEPVPEGEHWSVMWRRQTMKSVERPLEMEAAGIRQTIARTRTEEKINQLLEKLRTEKLKDLNLELLDGVSVSAQGDMGAATRPGVLRPRHAPAGLPRPSHDHR